LAIALEQNGGAFRCFARRPAVRNAHAGRRQPRAGIAARRQAERSRAAARAARITVSASRPSFLNLHALERGGKGFSGAPRAASLAVISTKHYVNRRLGNGRLPRDP
jgi:hypothetical protein